VTTWTRGLALIVEKVSTEIRAFMQQSETVQKTAELGTVAAALDSDAFAAYIAAETELWKKVIDDANIKME
jgi:tripartite-type tricarboxylate transporter receptor subunit TctC